MARGKVRPYRTQPARHAHGGTLRPSVRYKAEVIVQDVVVWQDDGWADLGAALDTTRMITQAFSITEAKGQHHISWQQAVDEAEDL